MLPKTKTLSSGYQMPIIGLGTWQSKPDEIQNAVIEAVKRGYRHIDCAFIYGNEVEIGRAIKDCVEKLKIVERKDLFVTSKLWNTKHKPADVEPALRESLKRLQLEYLDLYLIHWPIAFKSGDTLFPIDGNGDLIYEDLDYRETWKALEQCVELGLVRSIGLSNFNSEQVLRIMDVASIMPANLQIEIHPYHQQSKLVKFCDDHKIVVTSYSSFASPRRPWVDESQNVDIFQEPVLLKIADKYKKTVPQIVLRWLIERGIVVIPKSVTPARIDENFQLFDFNLSTEDMDDIGCINRDLRVILPMVERNGVKEPRDGKAPNYPYNIEF